MKRNINNSTALDDTRLDTYIQRVSERQNNAEE